MPLHQTNCGLRAQAPAVDHEHQDLADDHRLHGTSGRKSRYHQTSLSRDRDQPCAVKYYADNGQTTFSGSVLFTAAVCLVAPPIPHITNTLAFSSTLSCSFDPFALLPYLVFAVIVRFKWIILFHGIPDCNRLGILVLAPTRVRELNYTKGVTTHLFPFFSTTPTARFPLPLVRFEPIDVLVQHHRWRLDLLLPSLFLSPP